MPVFGVGKVHRIWTPKGGSPQYLNGSFEIDHCSLVVPGFNSQEPFSRELLDGWEMRHLLLRHHILLNGLESAWITKVLLGGDFPVFEPCRQDRPNSIEMGVHFIFDAFSA